MSIRKNSHLEQVRLPRQTSIRKTEYRLSDKQKDVVRVIMQGEKEGVQVNYKYIEANISYQVTHQALRYTLRYLNDRGLIGYAYTADYKGGTIRDKYMYFWMTDFGKEVYAQVGDLETTGNLYPSDLFDIQLLP